MQQYAVKVKKIINLNKWISPIEQLLISSYSTLQWIGDDNPKAAQIRVQALWLEFTDDQSQLPVVSF